MKHHPWIFSGAISSVEPGFAEGDWAEVYASDGRFIAQGWYDEKSHIILHLISWLKDRRMDEDFIRETAVNAFLSMISDKCSSSAFDRSLSMTKPRAKLVLLSSSFMSGFGSMDIDYMAASAGLSAGVMEPVGSVLTYMLDRNTVQPSNIGVWAASEIV